MRDNPGGWVALARAADWLEQTAGLCVESIGRGGFDRPDSCTLTASGRNLSYTVKVDGNWITVYACSMDSGDLPQRLLTTGDGPAGWAACCRLIRGLECSGCRAPRVTV